MPSLLARKWNSYISRQKVDKLTRKIFYRLYNISTDPIEFGNIRRSSEWGVLHDGELQWVVLIDLIAGRPIQYIITFSPETKQYSCFAATAKNNFSNIFQFSTTDIKELDYRLYELARHIPSLRERMLREYVYNESKNGPGRKWYQIFTSKSRKEEYLTGKIEALLSQQKISKSEATRIQTYILNLF